MSYLRPYPEYKPSGVEWLGDVPAHWDVKRLRFVATRNNSNVDKKSYEGQKPVRLCNYTDVYYNECITDELDFMRATASDDEIRRFSLTLGDVVITKDSEDPRDIGVPAIVSEPLDNVVCGYHLTILRSKEGLAPSFLFRVLQSHPTKAHFYVESPGITRFGLSQDTMGDLWIPFAPRSEQSAIAAFLDRETGRIDALVEKKRRFIELLKEKRQALITAAVTGKFDVRTGKPYPAYKPSGVEWLGDVPNGWSIIPLKNIISSIESGVSVNATDHPAYDTEFGVLKTSCVYSGEFDPSQNKKVIESEIDRVRCPVCQGSLIVSRMNTPNLVGAAGLVRKASKNIFLPDRLWQIRISKASVVYVHYWMQSEIYRSQIQMVCVGTSSSMQNLSQDLFRSFRFPFPPVSEQSAIADFLDRETGRVDALIEKTERSIELLKEKRAALITAAVTGKIDVRQDATEET